MTQGRRRALGQHFLKDRGLADSIADAALDGVREHHCRALMEIGPGKGAITEPLLEKIQEQKPETLSEFFLCERDPNLANFWKERSETRVEEKDFLDLPEEKWLNKTPLAVVSNLPYSAGTAIVVRLARHTKEIPVMVLMFQAEVAKRLRAERGTKDWGSLSLFIQNKWEVTKLFSAPPRAFSPPPKVDSEVVKLVRRTEPLLKMPEDPLSEEIWDKLLRTSFAHRRKMLRSGFPKKSIWLDALSDSGVDETKRAEALSWQEWQSLFESVLRLKRERS